MPIRKILDPLPTGKSIAKNKARLGFEVRDPFSLLLRERNRLFLPGGAKGLQIYEGRFLPGMVQISNRSSFPPRCGKKLLHFSKLQGMTHTVAYAVGTHLRKIETEVALVGQVPGIVEPHGPIWAGSYAVLASGAQILVNNNNTVFFPLMDGLGICPAGPYTRRPFALLACLEGKLQAAVAVSPGVGPKNPVPELPPAQAVNQLAGRDAGHAPSAALGVK